MNEHLSGGISLSVETCAYLPMNSVVISSGRVHVSAI